jgi:cation diffusion facilitator CzcD-associated flavoprotein CzcO
MPEHVDVLIVGAGLSGIAAAYHLQANCPKKTYRIVEGRDALGGTWDLFRYPGIRSDSDMHTMGFSFKPWTSDKVIADGAEILNYLKETAEQYGIDRHIEYNLRVVRVEWSSERAQWTVEMERSPSRERTTATCSFLFMCSGYYNYEKGHTPDFPGVDRFKGRIVHPQQWPEDLDYAGKQVVIIGSGATAVTLVPSMAQTAGHVTMLQRSPTYVVARPATDPFAMRMKKYLPKKILLRIVRWRNILLTMHFYKIARTAPDKFSAAVIGGARAQLGEGYDVDTHFTPKYKPWDQRLCLVPDGDLFKSIREGHATIVTDTIESFTETGIKLNSGKELQADIIVTATGLRMQLISGVEVYVDSKRIELAKTFNYKGTMFSGIPNFALTIGYTNASWTLKAEISCLYVCRLLNYMDRHRFRSAVPNFVEGSIGEQPMVTLTSGYVQRALTELPKQGLKEPWTLRQHFPRDSISLRFGKVNDGSMRFSR